MTEKRFRVHELSKYNYSDIGEYIDENHTDRPLRNDILVELLNELHEENQTVRSILKEYDDFDGYVDSAMGMEFLNRIAIAVGMELEE